jgi:mono/diheme cytochrome c family protein
MFSAGLAAAGFFGLALLPLRSKPADFGVPATPERVARGRYIYAVSNCDGCHSERDFTRFGAPVIAGGQGAGAAVAGPAWLGGAMAAPNITPDRETGIGAWSEGEIVRAIRDGIGRDGQALLPVMPYSGFRQMSDEDAAALVAYLRAMPPVRRAQKRKPVGFFASWLIRSYPRPAGHVPEIDPEDRVARGRYLATLGGCARCHTRDGAPALSGGREFRFVNARAISANLTPDRRTGLGRWSERDFVERFHQYREYLAKGAPAVGPEGFTPMPWLNLCQLPERDLSAIYAYLRDRKPEPARISWGRAD